MPRVRKNLIAAVVGVILALVWAPRVRADDRAELAFADLVRNLARSPLDFLMITGELFLSYKGPGSDLEILDLVKSITPTPASTVLTAVVRGCRPSA